MADNGFNVELEGYGDFKNMIDQYVAQFKSAKVPFAAILKYFWQWNDVNIFSLRSSGQYADLSEGYKDFKETAVGFIYPELVFDGVLRASLVGETSPYGVGEIGDDSLIMGTKAETLDGKPYSYYLNEGTNKMPARPFIIKDEQQMQSYARIFKETFVRQLDAIKKQG